MTQPPSDAVLPAAQVVTFGEVMALFLAEDGLPLRSASRFRRSFAGAESNVAAALARLGHTVAFAGRVGTDGFGEGVLSGLRATGVLAHLTADSDAPTGLLLRDASGHRPTEVVYARQGSAGSRLTPGDVDPLLVPGVRAVHITGITCALSTTALAACQHAMRRAHELGALVVFDPNIRLRLIRPARVAAVMGPLARAADIIVAGDDELGLLTGDPDPKTAAASLLTDRPRLVVGKRGADGCWATDGSSSWQEPAFPVYVVDPVGAGDAFAGALISALLRDLPVDRALAEASVVAAMVVATPGDVEGLPTAAERDALLAAGPGVLR